ncbi:class I SAM-dependent rRNA methyltransferase [Leeia sp.]|uniref:class I SAM-dependent rRNA methyltransferase n=1 Tax=Leeia sp. TaxID=2884678 RepID=UPI0035B1A3C0
MSTRPATPNLILKPGREKSLRQRHPWVFSGAVAQQPEGLEAGQTVAVRAHDHTFLGWAAFSPASQIRARVWTAQERDTVDRAFFQRRLSAAIAARQPLHAVTNAMRLVHAESDGLPGVIVDRFGDWLVVQLLSAGAAAWRDVLVDELVALTGIQQVYERSDVEVRALEGLQQVSGPLRGNAPDAPVMIEEHGLRYQVDIVSGQKTGFYLDQRLNRQRVAALAQGADVLNCFCFSGGFSLAALQAGASSVLSVDSSAEALALARQHQLLNGMEAARAEWVEADVFQYLRRLRDQNRQFDLIVLDPPKFAPTAAHVAKATRAYKDINLWALKLLKPGGHLATFTCSGGMGVELFQKVVAGAALDAGVSAQAIGRLHADLDHPSALSFPEGDYLNGLLLRKQ